MRDKFEFGDRVKSKLINISVEGTVVDFRSVWYALDDTIVEVIWDDGDTSEHHSSVLTPAKPAPLSVGYSGDILWDNKDGLVWSKDRPEISNTGHGQAKPLRFSHIEPNAECHFKITQEHVQLKCECGKERHGFANHANWCDMSEDRK